MRTKLDINTHQCECCGKIVKELAGAVDFEGHEGEAWCQDCVEREEKQN